MPSPRQKSASALRILAMLLGVALLVYLVERAGPGKLLQNAKTIGWGMLLVIAVTGFAHIVRTWAWRLALPGKAKGVSFWRTFGLRLISEADWATWRRWTGIRRVGARGLCSAPECRWPVRSLRWPWTAGFSSSMGAVVTIAGIFARRCHLHLLWRFAHICRAYCACACVPVGDWPCSPSKKDGRSFLEPARAAGRIPWFRGWINGKKSVIELQSASSFSFIVRRQAPSGSAYPQSRQPPPCCY